MERHYEYNEKGEMKMDTYLNKYKGKYRVKAHYDEQTKDFIRDDDGNLEDSFGDFYLSGRRGIEVKHGVGSELACYIPVLKLGKGVLKSYHESTIGNAKNKSTNDIIDELKAGGYINDVDILSIEVFFTFDAKHLDTLAPIIKLKTSGANISPFSTKNLPKTPYTIPKEDMDKYKEAKEGLEGLEIARLNEQFIADNFDSDFKTNLRKEMLKPLQYFHKKKKWEDYCQFIKENA